jgi:hypothetical protein
MFAGDLSGGVPMAGRVYQLKATIVGTKPPVWRRVLVEEAASLQDLHFVLQGAFGWYDCHLHEFEIDNVRYGTHLHGRPRRDLVVPLRVGPSGAATREPGRTRRRRTG